MRGRKPKPTSLKLILGKPGHRALPKNEPKPEAVREVPPAPLWFDDDARAEWERQAPRLIRSGTVASVDLTTLEAFCGTYQILMEYERAIAKAKADGGEFYLLTIDKLVLRRNQAATLLKAQAAELGMTPSSRSRVTKVDDAQDEDDEFFSKGAG